jgi:hypothetical protein
MVFYNNGLNYLYTIPNLIDTTKTTKTTNVISSNDITTYFIPPPFYYDVSIYNNVNADPTLRHMVTEFFLKKSIKWIKTQSEFSSYKNLLESLNSSKGYNIIYNLLREFCHKNNLKWYDLRDNNYNYNNVKHFLQKKFASF